MVYNNIEYLYIYSSISIFKIYSLSKGILVIKIED